MPADIPISRQDPQRPGRTHRRTREAGGAATRQGLPAPMATRDRALFATAVTWPAAIAVVDAVTGRHAILIGLLGIGPGIAVLTGRWRPTAWAGLWAASAAVLCGVPDGIFGTSEHLLLIAAIVAVAAVATSTVAAAEPESDLPARLRYRAGCRSRGAPGAGCRRS